MKYYDLENDMIVTREELKKCFEEQKASGDFEKDITFSMYIENCMYWNNGTLKPIPEEKNAAPDGMKTYVVIVDGQKWYEIKARSFEIVYRSEKVWFTQNKPMIIMEKETKETRFYEASEK